MPPSPSDQPANGWWDELPAENQSAVAEQFLALTSCFKSIQEEAAIPQMEMQFVPNRRGPGQAIFSLDELRKQSAQSGTDAWRDGPTP